MTWWRQKRTYILIIALTLCVIGGAMGGILFYQAQKSHQVGTDNKLLATTEHTPVSYSPILEWEKDTDAVFYEVEFFASVPFFLDANSESTSAIYRTRRVYQNRYNPPLQEFAADYLGKRPLYWRVRSMDFDGNPMTPFSKPAALWTSPDIPPMNAPEIVTDYSGERGTALLYPVYHWVQQYNAKSYEVALYHENPEVNTKVQPFATLFVDMSEIYDPEPRPLVNGFYWRVLSFDKDGNTIGNWSKVQYYKVSPRDNWEVGVLGDSISHGGGRFSFGPADFEFSYLKYLDFSTVNLSQSGDTAQMTRDRFDKDVLPFHPHYLLIMTGSNSLRAGENPQVVIDCLKTIQRKCLENNIAPIFLTLPPVNPDNIQHIFKEPTAPDYQERFAVVNAYIRSQVYIDTAAAFDCPDGLLPTKYALDGLHPDVIGKKLMGERINSEWPKAKAKADKLLINYQTEE
ncbi:SGNH/GDSL hydrolase family protein [Selenomonas ruminantium]|uniref:Lysophospholipase L1 n=1 Tax=Selenomonas ruminantium TaxID=971 RepID=A0A1H0UUF0_SELRU|nr:GDSL-type esterase/lipase family protein [Selenomonas ruminantium]SDP69889.1 Lysophospholipase L1 [Selenomonas ruminantium]